MAMRKLRVYTGPELDATSRSIVQEAAPNDTVTVTLGEVLPLLADAVASNRTWLGDFADDPIRISSDLHDVLQAYRRPGA